MKNLLLALLALIAITSCDTTTKAVIIEAPSYSITLMTQYKHKLYYPETNVVGYDWLNNRFAVGDTITVYLKDAKKAQI